MTQFPRLINERVVKRDARRVLRANEAKSDEEISVDYLSLGSSGLTVSRLGLGMMSYGDPGTQTWALREDDAEPIVRHAVDAGIIFFDTADMYSGGVSEEITGRLLRRLFPSRD